MKISAVIIEDEPIATDILQNYLNRFSDIDCAGQFDNSQDAYQFLISNKVDVAFVDINIAPVRGIDLIKSLPEIPNIIFTTAYPEHAVEGFELSAIDYLVKPISFDRFQRAIEKLKEKLNRGTTVDTIHLKTNGRMYPIKLNEILYCESMGDYLKVVTNDENIIIHETMKHMVKRCSKDFYRIHKSFIINKTHISFIEGGRIKVKDQFLPIGAKYKEDFLRWFQVK